jgi:hypothetical protein
MAYMAKIDTQNAQPLVLPIPTADSADFSPLEWSVIRLARIDRLWTIRASGRLRRFFNWLAGRGNPSLANPQLEALRRMAVLTWHYGFTVPGDDIAEFLSAGFSTDQYELMAGRINSALGTSAKPSA